MIKDVKYFTNEIEKQMKKNERIKPANITYGSNVIPILEMYKNLSNFEKKKSLREAIENLLTDSDEDKRKFAVEICLGFIVFKDAI